MAPILAPPHPVGCATTEHFPEMKPLRPQQIRPDHRQHGSPGPPPQLEAQQEGLLMPGSLGGWLLEEGKEREGGGGD